MKERSFLHWFLIISLGFHLALLVLIPFYQTTSANTLIAEGEGKFKVDFVRLEGDHEGETQVSKGTDAPKGTVQVKEEQETQVAKAPEVKETPTPKPPVKTNTATGAESTEKATTSLTKTQVPATQPKAQPAPKSTSTTPAAKPAEQNTPKTTTSATSDKNQVVTSNNSNKVVQVSEDKPAAPAQSATGAPSEGSAASGPKETGQPTQGEPEVEKKPALPTDPSTTIAKFMRPVYPKNAANENVEGAVELVVSVEATGGIKDVKIVKSSGDKRLDDVSINTVKRGWTFNSYPYAYTVGLTVTFKTGDVSVVYGQLKFQE